VASAGASRRRRCRSAARSERRRALLAGTGRRSAGVAGTAEPRASAAPLRTSASRSRMSPSTSRAGGGRAPSLAAGGTDRLAPLSFPPRWCLYIGANRRSSRCYHRTHAYVTYVVDALLLRPLGREQVQHTNGLGFGHEVASRAPESTHAPSRSPSSSMVSITDSSSSRSSSSAIAASGFCEHASSSSM